MGNKSDVGEDKRAVPYSRGQALADEYGIPFFETSAKENSNVEAVFTAVARDVMQRLAQEAQDAAADEGSAPGLQLTSTYDQQRKQRSGCC